MTTAPQHRFFPASGISLRLVLQVLALSVVLTVVLTLFQLYVNYRSEITTIERRLDEIERGPLNSVANSLWNVDTTNLTLLMEGIYRLPDMQSVELRETLNGVDQPVVIILGSRLGGPTITRDLVLNRQVNGVPQEIGRLHLEASLASVFQRLRDQTIIIVVSHGLRALLIAAAILYLVHAHITRHITTMAEAMGRFDLHGSKPGITLDKPKGSTPDELDSLAQSFNRLTDRLRGAYQDLAASHQNLAVARHHADANAARLAEVNEELQRLALITAHHLREPLRPIMISAQCIQRHETGQHPDIQQWTGQITNSVVHLQALLRDFHRYVGVLVESPKLMTIDLNQIAISAREHVQTQSPGEAEITIAVLPQVRGDRKMLHEVFFQLCSNAVQHRRRSAPVAIHIWAEQVGEDCQIVIADDGPGIAPDMTDRVFHVFESVHGRKADQTGLGLPMCRAMLRAHGGKIWIVPTSPDKPGTELRFSLPAALTP